MTRPGSRLPFEPLAREVGAPTVAILAMRVGVTARTIYRWANAGVPEAVADRAAVAVGPHPAYIWPEQWGRC